MILLWGMPGDDPLMAVHDALLRRGAPVSFLDQRAVLRTEAELRVDGRVTGLLRLDGDELALEEIRAVYLRPYETARIPTVRAAGSEGATAHATALEDILVSWLDVTPALVLNRPAAMASNGSKPYQASLIRAAGLAVPDTLLTTEAESVRAFVEEHGRVIYKSISGVRSIVTALEGTELDRLDEVAWCPTQFQAWVPGVDVRVHVVGTELFSCEISSKADDYRYAAAQGDEARFRPSTLPPEVADACRRLARKLELPLAGIDLRRTPDGEWCCFEVNPSPGFTYFQAAVGHPIADAVAELLMSAPDPVHPMPTGVASA
jgi:hypothetical protein